jgi:hypothetical protein
LLGGRGNLKFIRAKNGLQITLPDERPCGIAFALKINP